MTPSRSEAYTFKLAGLDQVRARTTNATRGQIQVTRNGRKIALMQPEKRFYAVQQMPMTEAAIDSGITRDLYVSLGEPVGQGAWVVRVYHKPFVDWIWGGAFLMAIGGVLAISDRRYRLAGRDQHRRPAGARRGRPQPPMPDRAFFEVSVLRFLLSDF